MRKKVFTIFISLSLLIFLIFFSGCKPKKELRDIALEECKKICEIAKKEMELNSQCLSDIYEWKVEDWVCDIAHWPRENIDNLPENQCKDYREGKARHFIELDKNCEFIRAY